MRRSLIRLLAGYVALCTALTLAAFLVPACATWDAPRHTAVVLGASGGSPDALGADSAARVRAAVDLYDRGVVKRLHMTGTGEDPALSAGENMARLAADMGVPEAQITWEGTSRSTLENALLSKPALAAAPTLLVVTEPFHTLRGAASLAWAGRPAAVCASEDYSFGTTRWAVAFTREIAAWGLNIARGSAYSAARALGVQDSLPEGFLY